MIDPTEIIDKSIDAIDDNIESNQEAEEERTERHRIDQASDNKLSKMIRPIITLYSGFIWGMMLLLSIWFEVNEASLYSATGAFMSCIGFYFNSKRQERIAEKKSSAAIQIEKIKLRDQVRENRHNRRMQKKS